VRVSIGTPSAIEGVVEMLESVGVEAITEAVSSWVEGVTAVLGDLPFLKETVLVFSVSSAG
jgi:hypothetical protein